MERNNFCDHLDKGAHEALIISSSEPVIEKIAAFSGDDKAWKLDTGAILTEELRLLLRRIGQDELAKTVPSSAVGHRAAVDWIVRYVTGLDLSRICDGQIRIAPLLLMDIKRSYVKAYTKYGYVIFGYDTAESLAVDIEIPEGLTAELELSYPARATAIYCEPGDAAEKIRDSYRDGTFYYELPSGRFSITDV